MFFFCLYDRGQYQSMILVIGSEFIPVYDFRCVDSCVVITDLSCNAESGIFSFFFLHSEIAVLEKDSFFLFNDFPGH